jgi:plastocyanin
MKAFYTLLTLLIPFVGYGQTPTSHTIYASDYLIFSPSELSINLGDTVYFENLSTHNAVEVSEETYNSYGTASNGGFELYSDGYVVFEEVGTHYYVCTPHVQMGMKGKIIINQIYNTISIAREFEIGSEVTVTASCY